MSSRDFNDIIDFPQKIALQSLNIDVSKPLIAIVCAQSGMSFVHKNAQNTAEWVAKGVAKASRSSRFLRPFRNGLYFRCFRGKKQVCNKQIRAALRRNHGSVKSVRRLRVRCKRQSVGFGYARSRDYLQSPIAFHVLRRYASLENCGQKFRTQ